MTHPRAWPRARRLARALLLAAGLAAAGLAGAAPDPAACPPAVQASATPAPARDRGPLWRLQRDGRTSYLYGTVHVGRPDWATPGPRVQAALRASRILALEIDLEDPALVQQLYDIAQTAAAAAEAAGRTDSANPPPGPAATAAADPGQAAAAAALQARLDAAAIRACLPAGSLAGLPPLLQASTLTLLDARWLGLDIAHGLDRRLGDIARRQGLRVVSLETLAAQLGALQPPDAQALQRQVDRALQQIEDGSARRVTARLVDAWERGDLATLARYADWCECSATAEDTQLWQRMIDGRNPGLAQGIEAWHARGSVFAAVGALHMTGPAALPALLAARGFRVERMGASDSRPAAPRRPGAPLPVPGVAGR